VGGGRGRTYQRHLGRDSHAAYLRGGGQGAPDEAPGHAELAVAKLLEQVQQRQVD